MPHATIKDSMIDPRKIWIRHGLSELIVKPCVAVFSNILAGFEIQDIITNPEKHTTYVYIYVGVYNRFFRKRAHVHS